MARKSLFKDLITLPWWVNLVVIGAIIFVGLRYALPVIEFKSQIHTTIAQAFYDATPYLVVPFFLAAITSAFLAWRKSELFDRQTSIGSIKALSWKNFESLVSKVYNRQGFSVFENMSDRPDDGIDLVLYKDGLKTLVQYKNWRANKVGAGAIREMLRLIISEKAHHGIVICSGSFTSDAESFAQSNDIELVDGTKLSKMISAVQTKATITTP